MAARGKSSGKPKAGGSKTADKPANPIESAEDSTQVDAEPASIEAGDSGAPVESEMPAKVSCLQLRSFRVPCLVMLIKMPT